MAIEIISLGGGTSASKSAFISQLGATTRKLNAQIKKTIIQVKAVDTGRMKNNTKVNIMYNFTTDKFTITQSGVTSTFYYIFVDEGTIHIKPRDITDKTLNKQVVQLALDKLFDKWIDYIIDRQFETN
tara:strand:- start:183 stop:566 length:384 start_codon:yes stop_codon:yes gene_type:complete